MIFIPIFDFECGECGTVFEKLIIRTDDFPICPKCGGEFLRKIFNMTPNVRMNAESVLKSMPDPSPPLEELRGRGSEGYKDKPEASSNLKDYKRSKDKQGNIIWTEKKKVVIDMGR